MILYAATTNPGKLHEFAECASGDGIEVLALPDLKSMPEPIEDAPDFMGNAELKAVAYSQLSPGLLVFADDSGLEIDALDGRPGVRSARFADDLNYPSGSGLSKDDRNICAVLSLLRQADGPTWDPPGCKARFRCALALAQEGEILLRADGICPGEILPSPRGANGFGYDPLLFLPELGRTMAELSPADKWLYSHRGQAFRSLLLQLGGLGLQPSEEDRTS